MQNTTIPDSEKVKKIIPKKIVVIGSGIGGLGTAALLAKAGHDVTIYEKNERIGGRASLWKKDGYTFDMGPSWYMMPDIFEHFFRLLGEDVNELLELERLSPSYRIFFEGQDSHLDFYSDFQKNAEIFESIEPGSSTKLFHHLERGKYQYEVARREFMFKNYDKVTDFFTKRIATEGRKLPLFSSMEKIVNSQFDSPILQKVLQYQTVLLGTAPNKCPGIYSLMNHIDMNEGIWYPKGGLYAVTEALIAICEKHGVTIHTNSPVARIESANGTVQGITLHDGTAVESDIVVSNADLTHTDLELLGKERSERSSRYWDKKIMSPSGFIMYLGVDGPIDSLDHHNLYFLEDWEKGNAQVFNSKTLPKNPSFYLCCPSKTDSSVAPKGKENLFLLVPIPFGAKYTEDELKEYEGTMIEHVSKTMNIPNLAKRIEVSRTFCVDEFIADYNAYKGNALSGMAHSLTQTAFFRPNNKHKNIDNLYFAGAGTNPGIGVPICLISAELVYKRVAGITDPEPLFSL